MNVPHQFICDASKLDWPLFRYLAKHGAEGLLEPLTPDEQAYVDNLIKKRGGEKFFVIKQCFMNAQKLILDDHANKLMYCEGYMSGLIPVLHAWVTINNKIVDPTVAAIRRKYPKDRTFEYFGIPFTHKEVILNMTRTRYYGPLTESKAFTHYLREQKPV